MMKHKKLILAAALLVAMLLLITGMPVFAFQGNVGGSPYSADLLVSGLNTGSLDPGQEYWYAYSRLDLGDPGYNSIILSLNFGAEGTAVANRVNFQVFTFEQVEGWLKDGSGPIDSLGLGTPASADFDVNTGERFWAGPVAASEVYYIRIFNLSPSPVQFRLTALGQSGPEFDGFLSVNPAVDHPSSAIPAAVSVPAPLNSPAKTSVAAALPVTPGDGSAASTSWLLAAQAIQGLPPQEAAAWLMSAAKLGWLPGSGAATTAPATAPAAAPAAVPVNPNPNAPAKEVEPPGGDTEDPPAVVASPIETEPEPDPNAGENIYPNRPLHLLDGPNTGRLGPKTEHWYTFTPGKVDGKLIENYSITMFFTPGEPNISRYVTFEVFTGSQYPIWARGTPDDMEHFGAGQWLSRDGDYVTGERLWHGTVVDGDQYYVKLVNGTNKWIDYHMLPGDIVNTELGEPTVKPVKAAVTTPTGQDIGAPLLAQKGRTSGHLSANSDVWYSFTTPNSNPDSFDFLHYGIELTHKPGYGNVANQVNVEIYPYQMQHLWQRGTGDQMKPLGAGSAAAYNETADTHTWAWDGHLVSNTTYFVRVRNDYSQPIDFELAIRSR